MPPAPYQPSLLRLLHGLTASVAGLCWFSGLAIYSQFDGRWGRVPLQLPEAIDWHGSLGVLLILLVLPFAAYACSLGRARLRRAANLAPLLALLLAIGSGKLMEETWLRRGELHHLVYQLHLSAWLLISAMVLWHLLALLRRGGPLLAASIWRPGWRTGDSPRQWPSQVKRFFGFSSSTGPHGPSD
jgi:hypothetical protein